jgi:hypothetical protein
MVSSFLMADLTPTIVQGACLFIQNLPCMLQTPGSSAYTICHPMLAYFEIFPFKMGAPRPALCPTFPRAVVETDYFYFYPQV